MKILHVGGYYTVTSELVQQQQQFGNDVVWVGGSRREEPFEAPLGFAALERSVESLQAARFDIVQVNHKSGLIGESADYSIEVFTRLKAQGARLYFFCFDEPNGDPDLERVLTRTPFTHIFKGSVECLPNPTISWSWLAPPLPLAVPPSPWHELNPLGVRFLHIPFRTMPEDSARIVRTFEEIRASGRCKVDLKITTPEAIASAHAFGTALSECDVFVESLMRESPGLLGYEAMLRGKLVLSGNSQHAQGIWQQLGMCPAMHTTTENLSRRIESIAREPRCLRDLSKRSREYVELYHDPHSMAERSLAVYQQNLTA